MSKLSKNNSGFLELVLVLWVGCAFAWFVWVWSDYRQAEKYKVVYQAWVGDCYGLGGEVKLTGANLTDCFVRDKPCTVSGYEEYAVASPNPKFNNLPPCGGLDE